MLPNEGTIGLPVIFENVHAAGLSGLTQLRHHLVNVFAPRRRTEESFSGEGDRVENGIVPREGLLSALASGDVAENTKGTDELSACVEMWRGGENQGARFAVGADDFQFVRALFAGAAAFGLLLQNGKLRGRGELAQIATDESAARHSKDLFCRGIGKEKILVSVYQPRTFALIFDEHPIERLALAQLGLGLLLRQHQPMRQFSQHAKS